jgi:hypothetical protein
VIAGCSSDSVRGAKRPANRWSNVSAAEHLAAEREIMLGLIGKVHQVDAVTVNFEILESKLREVR